MPKDHAMIAAMEFLGIATWTVLAFIWIAESLRANVYAAALLSLVLTLIIGITIQLMRDGKKQRGHK